MINSQFDETTGALLTPILEANELLLRSPTGKIMSASPYDTLLAKISNENIDPRRKYKNTIMYMAKDPVNPKKIIEEGCPNCSRKLVSYQIIGDEAIAIHGCLCGATW